MLEIIRQHHDVWGECPPGFEDNLRLIERAGRICWQSQEKITETSFLGFCRMLAEKKHFAMIEHSWLVIYSIAHQTALEKSRFIHWQKEGKYFLYAGNYRAFMEALGYTELEQIKNLMGNQVRSNIPRWARSISVKFKTNRAMTHEL